MHTRQTSASPSPADGSGEGDGKRQGDSILSDETAEGDGVEEEQESEEIEIEKSDAEHARELLTTISAGTTGFDFYDSLGQKLETLSSRIQDCFTGRGGWNKVTKTFERDNDWEAVARKLKSVINAPLIGLPRGQEAQQEGFSRIDPLDFSNMPGMTAERLRENILLINTAVEGILFDNMSKIGLLPGGEAVVINPGSIPDGTGALPDLDVETILTYWGSKSALADKLGESEQTVADNFLKQHETRIADPEGVKAELCFRFTCIPKRENEGVREIRVRMKDKLAITELIVRIFWAGAMRGYKRILPALKEFIQELRSTDSPQVAMAVHNFGRKEPGKKLSHEELGEWYIQTFERGGDKPVVLSSSAFDHRDEPVTDFAQPWRPKSGTRKMKVGRAGKINANPSEAGVEALLGIHPPVALLGDIGDPLDWTEFFVEPPSMGHQLIIEQSDEWYDLTSMSYHSGIPWGALARSIATQVDDQLNEAHGERGVTGVMFSSAAFSRRPGDQKPKALWNLNIDSKLARAAVSFKEVATAAWCLKNKTKFKISENIDTNAGIMQIDINLVRFDKGDYGEGTVDRPQDFYWTVTISNLPENFHEVVAQKFSYAIMGRYLTLRNMWLTQHWRKHFQAATFRFVMVQGHITDEPMIICFPGDREDLARQCVTGLQSKNRGLGPGFPLNYNDKLEYEVKRITKSDFTVMDRPPPADKSANSTRVSWMDERGEDGRSREEGRAGDRGRER
eukprot:CAMPEP_0181337800 /NCGR_PEP_ID=MMETSP1101-20121128/28247_1 /TAXON_ID=46948 /ORGANISM="Rhodomonas abbreviata, Strain Caron Lab Isolate" /LENGTH=737 /DNA_ID=CAMNT_0023448389 /DNA_START=630 /DNA_END=2840 /DNA_ORIENTATION=+